ncbi:XPG domain containing-domain-containing protein [Biscogniauxia marginata]|nr:XPG domain containing-domain-containing protein [Biscogniauxia marginata]
MGIRGLTAAISRFGVFSPLSGGTVVIDGPALVHRILEGILKIRSLEGGFVCQPSYTVLGRMVIGWLDELRKHDITVRKIYFDGYLPPSKWGVRRQRLYDQFQSMRTLLSSHPSGSARPHEDLFGDLKAEMSLTRIFMGQRFSRLPKPPFLVPAVIELLGLSQYWGPLVQVVPGEADMYCAEDVRRNGGTVLTNDSDLLIEDLGPKGTVAFFRDVVPVDPSSIEAGITACKFSYHDINNVLALTNIGGLLRVAFEMSTGSLRFWKAIDTAKRNQGEVFDSPKYQLFVKDHQMKEYLSAEHPIFKIISIIDPRISEVIVQSRLLEEEGIVPDGTGETPPRGPKNPSIFLPVLIEDQNKRSAWTTSTPVRQLAYSILQDSVSRRSADMIEYRVLDPADTKTGRLVEIPGPGETVEQCARLARTLAKMNERAPLADMRWFAFAIYQDVEWSASEEQPPLSAALVYKTGNGNDDTEEWYSWDLIHFTAHVQASLYSFRIMKQVLDVVTSLGLDLSAPARQLHESLASLPIIAEWPTVEDMPGLLSRFREANALTSITDILGIPEIAKPEDPPESDKPNKRQKQEQPRGPLDQRKQKQKQRRPLSVNPFAILSQASQD